MSTAPDDLAAQALVHAWAWRWAFILSLGVAPLALRKLLNLAKDSAAARESRQAFHLAAFAVCILSGNLMLDTFALESESPARFARRECAVSDAAFWGFVQRYACEDGTSVFAYGHQALAPGVRHALLVFPRTGILVKANVCMPDGCTPHDFPPVAIGTGPGVPSAESAPAPTMQTAAEVLVAPVVRAEAAVDETARQDLLR